MPYALLHHDTGLLTDIQHNPHLGREAEGESVEVREIPDYSPGTPLGYDRQARRAVPNAGEIAAERERRVARLREESTEAWAAYPDLCPEVTGEASGLPLVYPDALVENLERRLQALRFPVFRAPSALALKRLVDVCFFAGLESEEARAIQFSVVHVDPRASDGIPQQPTWSPFRFGKSRPFSVEEVVKLAPALDFTQTMICVGETGQGGDLEIWGLVATGRSAHRSRRGEHAAGGFWGPFLNIAVPRRSQLIFQAGAIRLLEYRGGETIESPLPVFQEDGQVYRALQACKVSGHFSIRPAVFLIARRIAELGHGGTLLLVAAEEEQRALAECTLKYRGDGECDLVRSIAQHLAGQDEFLDHLRTGVEGVDWRSCIAKQGNLYQLLGEAADAFANLAMVDGALLLAADLRVLAFGTRINSQRPVETFQAQNLLGSHLKRFDLSQLGTRHSSAAAFVNQFPRSLAFVASQDGVASVFKRHKEKVVLWRPVEMDVCALVKDERGS